MSTRKVVATFRDTFIVQEGGIFKAFNKKDYLIQNRNATAIAHSEQPTVELVIEVLKSI